MKRGILVKIFQKKGSGLSTKTTSEKTALFIAIS